MRRVLRIWTAGLLLAFAPVSALARSPDSQEKDSQENKAEGAQADTFFAGTVEEVTQQSITVSRVNLGKKEKRVFRITPDTKFEGKPKAKVRVTVRYLATDEGETALLIIVRSGQKKTSK